MNHLQRIRQAELKSGSGEDLKAARRAAINSLAFNCLDSEDAAAFADVDFGDNQRNLYPGNIFPDWIVKIRADATARRPGALRRMKDRRKAFAQCMTSKQARALYLRYCPGVMNFDAPTLQALQEIGEGPRSTRGHRISD